MQEFYAKYRRLLFTLAYQLTGSAADAEDAVQDVFMKFYVQKLDDIAEPKAYLCKMVTNRCLDLLKSARKQREEYYGYWLPEPIFTPEDDSFDKVIRADLLSYGMLVLLERLTPMERAVFVLREALHFDYSDIAGLIGATEVNCRKLASRARGKIGISEDEPVIAESASGEWARHFVSALEQGEIDTVLSMLTEDVKLISDGGGKVVAASHPIVTRDYVARFLFGLLRKATNNEEEFTIELTPLNGQVGIVVRLGKSIDTVALVQLENGAVKELYMVRNPDKLQHFAC